MKKKCKKCKGSGWITFDRNGKIIPLELDEREKMIGVGEIFDHYNGYVCRCNKSTLSVFDLRWKDD